MLTKHPVDEAGLVTVGFSHPHDGSMRTVTVVGDFNDWTPDANPMVADTDESRCEIALQPGRSYRFRYLIDGERWENDWRADRYAANDFGGEDSVVDLSDAAAGITEVDAPPTARRARGAKAAETTSA